MFARLVRWFGGGAGRPARAAGGARFTPRLEDLEGRDTPAGAGVVSLSVGDGISAMGGRRAGEELPELTGSQPSGVEFGVGVGLMGKASGGGVEV